MSYQEEYEAWLIAHAAWEAEVAAIDAAYNAAVAQYEAELAARDAALAAWATWQTSLTDMRQDTEESFLQSIAQHSAMRPLLFTIEWAGPAGYWSALSSWINSTGPIPASVTQPHKWIHDRLVNAGIATAEWDAHVAACLSLDWIRQNPPAPVPEPPEYPQPPVYPPEPQPPTPPVQAPADYNADPTGYTAVATGVRVNDAKVLNRLWNSALKPNEIADLVGGPYYRLDVRGVASRPAGSAPITFRAIDAFAIPVVRRDTTVGGSNAMFFGPGAGGVIFEGLNIEVDDTAGVMTASSPMKNFTFRRCNIYGLFNPIDGTGLNDNSKWGMLLNDHGDWLLEDCTIRNVRQEHACYGHNRTGNVTWRRVKVRHCQRTAFQDVSRGSEGPPGVGDVLLEDCEIQDVCLESGGGGSAITCRGGNPTANWVLRRVKVRLGCDPALKAPYNENITGSVMFDSGMGSHPGGTKSVLIDNCDFEVGTVYPGVNQARRVNASFADVAELTIKDSRIVQGPAAQPIVLEIASSVGTVKFVGANLIVGRIKYKGDPEYPSFTAFQQAHPELFVP